MEPDAGGEAGVSGGSAGVNAAGTSGAAGTAAASTSGTGGALAAGGSAGSAAGAAAGTTGSAGTAAAAGTSGAAGTSAAKCEHINGPIVVTAPCPGKPTCSKSCSCSAGYNSSNQNCRTDNAHLDAQLPCLAAAEPVISQPGAAAMYYPPDGLRNGFCNRSGAICYKADSMLCVSDCSACP